MNAKDYPAGYIASGQTAVKLERNYFRLLKTELILFVGTSLVGILAAIPSTGLDRPLAIAAAILIAGAFLVLWRVRKRRLERKWFQYRAVAESMKTATWRYMMQAPPFEFSGEDGDVEEKFLATLKAIGLDRVGVEGQAHEGGSEGGQITDFMRTMQRLPVEQRKDFYLRARLADQEQWYEGKSRQNRQSSTRWWNLILATQVMAIGLAIVRIVYPSVPLSPVSFLMTGASSMLAWTQSKRHEDLVEPYAVAAQELRELGGLSTSVTDSQSLCRFVSDVEETISREHTKWLARRSIETGKPQSSGSGR